MFSDLTLRPVFATTGNARRLGSLGSAMRLKIAPIMKNVKTSNVAVQVLPQECSTECMTFFGISGNTCEHQCDKTGDCAGRGHWCENWGDGYKCK